MDTNATTAGDEETAVLDAAQQIAALQHERARLQIEAEDDARRGNPAARERVLARIRETSLQIENLTYVRQVVSRQQAAVTCPVTPSAVSAGRRTELYDAR